MNDPDVKKDSIKPGQPFKRKRPPQIQKSEEIKSFLSDYQEDMTITKEDSDEKILDNKEPAENVTVSLGGELLTGAMFITLVDSVIPMIIGFANQKYGSTKIDIKKLKLSASQKKELGPVCDEVVKQWEVNADPTTILIISLVGIYGIKFMQLVDDEKIADKK